MPYAPEPLSRRHATAAGAVALLHIGLFVVLKNGLAQDLAQWATGPIQVSIISEDLVPQENPPPPVKIALPNPFVPEPEIDIEFAPPPPITAIATVIRSASSSTPAVSDATERQSQGRIRRTSATIDVRRSADPQAYYPAASQRLSEEGAAVVELCIDPSGRVKGPTTIQSPSGSGRLDRAALKYAATTRWIAATEDGNPVESCTALSIRFMLKK